MYTKYRLLLVLGAAAALIGAAYRLTRRPALSPYDVTLVGFLMSYDGLGRQPIWLIDCLKDDLRMNWIAPNPGHVKSSFFDVPKDIADIALNQDLTPGNVVFFTDILAHRKRNVHEKVPQESLIKIASSMVESPTVPQRIVDILNRNFDAVVVPDEWLVKPYLSAGVTIPIFVLPLGVYLEDFLSKKARQRPGKPFTFGNTCAIDLRKNHVKLIEAFHHAFGNNPDVRLRINARFADKKIAKAMRETVRKLGVSNITITYDILSMKQYSELLDSFDCYVTLSLGEGFSIPPREALAAGIPVILSDNTAHKTICQTGFTRPVACPLLVDLPYDIFHVKRGFGFDCSLEDASKALRDVYHNYPAYLAKAQQACTWAATYTKKHLRPYFLNMLKPKNVCLGKKNAVTATHLMTDSPALLKKYLMLGAKKLQED